MPETPFAPAIVVPAYQAGATIAAVVRDARACGLPVLVVDDGSTDGTAALARQAGAEVLHHPRNRGKGAALRTGMRHLAATGYTHALSMDADGQHLAREIPALVTAARVRPEALVLGVRMIGTQEVAAANLLGNRVANWAVRRAADVDARDTQSGFRVYPLATVLPLAAAGDHFEYETTIIVHAARAGIPIVPVPVAVYYPPVGERRSHYRKVVDTLRIIRAVAPLLRRR
jgi:glycosyltransferase involved in cell wall biosynthesis